MKKYTSGAFAKTTYGIYKEATDTITSFPASIIANGGNITPWTVYGNTVEGVSVGDKTANEYNKNTMVMDGLSLYNSNRVSVNATTGIIAIPCETLTEYTVSVQGVTVTVFRVCITDSDTIAENTPYTKLQNTVPTDQKYTFETTENTKYILLQFTYNETVLDAVMFNTGETAKPLEPYGYNVSIICNSIAYNCYISDVLRKSTGADPVYDIMSSTGVITRNVDTDGTPLVTPTTENFTAPTIATVAGSQSVSFDTTIKPSKAELTYTGWHRYEDKEYSGGGWGVNILATNKKSILGV